MITINEKIFAQMIDSVKHCVAKNPARPELEYIWLRSDGTELTAIASDGFRAARTTIQLFDPTNGEIDCFIKPIKIKPSRSGKNPVFIKLEDDRAVVQVTTEYGDVKYCFKQFFTGDSLRKVGTIFNETKNLDRKHGLNQEYVKQAVSALNHIGNKDHLCILETQENPNGLILIRAKANTFTGEQLILPMRLSDAERGGEDA